MKDVFACWPDVRQILTKPEKVLWLFDFDGTLAPIAEHPHEADMPADNRRLLATLARRFPGHVGILSGRPIQTLKRKVRLRKLWYAGDQGFEIRGPSVEWAHPLSIGRRRTLDVLAHDIREHLVGIPGAWLEDKHWTLCLHYRLTQGPHRDAALKAVRHFGRRARRQGFTVLRGLMAEEIISYPKWNKGQAARWIQHHCQLPQVFYVGDDVTDETVFRCFGQKDLGVRVGQSKTAALFYIDRQSAMNRLLNRILTL